MKRIISILGVLAAMITSEALAAGAEPATPAKATQVKKDTQPAKGAKAAKPSTTAKSAKAPAAKKLPPPVALPAATIVEKNIAARGGLDAWRKVNSLTMSGDLDAGGKKEAKLPFVLSMMRPHRSRVELKFQDQTAVQVWDGKQGWKVRPFLNRNEVEPYTEAEAREAAAAAELDGPLVDHAAKGTKVEVAGTELVEGRYTYKLKLTMKGGAQRYLWIDASTFLEAKIDGDPRKLDGRMRAVAVFYRDFRKVGGLMFPYTMETAVDKVKDTHKMTFRAIKVNPPLEDRLFARPELGKLAAR